MQHQERVTSQSILPLVWKLGPTGLKNHFEVSFDLLREPDDEAPPFHGRTDYLYFERRTRRTAGIGTLSQIRRQRRHHL